MAFMRVLLFAALAGILTGAPALADPPRDANQAWKGVRQDRAMPLPQLERRVVPLMRGGDYLGPELNGDTYRFKFIQNGRVKWVDVDGQGHIIRRSDDR